MQFICLIRRNKFNTFCLSAIVLIAVVITVAVLRGPTPPPEKDAFTVIAESFIVKFETADGYCVFVHSNSWQLISHFSNPDEFAPCDQPITDWLYRLTFNPPEHVIGGQVIEVLVGADCFSMDGQRYTYADGRPFRNLVEYLYNLSVFYASEYEGDWA